MENKKQMGMKNMKNKYTDENGKRIVVKNCLNYDKNGVIHCQIHEDEPGYRAMKGRGAYQSPWYLAYMKDHMKEDGSIDYSSLNKAADNVAEKINSENGYNSQDVFEVVASSMRAQNLINKAQSLGTLHPDWRGQ